MRLNETNGQWSKDVIIQRIKQLKEQDGAVKADGYVNKWNLDRSLLFMTVVDAFKRGVRNCSKTRENGTHL